MVNPGGTGTPAFDISASPAPLPPSTSRMRALPSARPSPNKKMYGSAAGWLAPSEAASAADRSSVAFVIRTSLAAPQAGRLRCGPLERRQGDAGIEPHASRVQHDHPLAVEEPFLGVRP